MLLREARKVLWKQPCFFPPALPFPWCSAWIPGAAMGKDAWLHCLQKPLCCSSLSLHVWAVPGACWALPGAHRCRPSSSEISSVCSGLGTAKAVLLSRGNGSWLLLLVRAEGDVPTACTLLWLMMVQLSTCLFLCLLPGPRENRCFLNRGADDVMEVCFGFVWGFLLLMFRFGFFGF